MNNQEYFLNTSLSYQLKAALRELADFKSGKIYQELRRDYESIIRSQNREMENCAGNGMNYLLREKRSPASGRKFWMTWPANMKKKWKS